MYISLETWSTFLIVHDTQPFILFIICTFEFSDHTPEKNCFRCHAQPSGRHRNYSITICQCMTVVCQDSLTYNRHTSIYTLVPRITSLIGSLNELIVCSSVKSHEVRCRCLLCQLVTLILAGNTRAKNCPR